jgi:ABC-type nitrate/sulfonate/bicarbonate transport system substrate-binding protein
VDIVPITEPLWSKFKNKYRAVIVASETLPPLDNVVGVTTVEMAEKKGDFIRAVIRARRKAVIFMREHPDEAAEIVAKQYNIDVEVAKERRAQSHDEQDARRSVLGRGRDLSRRAQTDDRSTAVSWRDQRRSRLRQNHRYAISSGRSEEIALMRAVSGRS